MIYDFIGVFRLEGDDSYKESLSLENTMWANTVLASGIIYGLILYTGKETRMAMNSKAPRTKFGALDLELNRVSKLLFGVMMALALVILLLRGIDNIWYIHYFKYMLLLSSIIPISMRINLDFAKALFSYRINVDKDIPDSVARNSTIPEELGRIQYLLTDKTGTLTQNDMIFKKLCLERGQYTEYDLPVMKKIVKKQCLKSSGPAKDVEEKMSKEEVVQTALSAFQNNSKKKKYFKRDKEAVLRDLITALILCHNVTPVIENGEKFYQASSPDEIALVKIAESLDMSLLERTQTMILIKNAHGVQEKYKILANFPFSSETKRMGIILRHLETNRIIFYLKGADTIMKHKIPEFQRGTVQDEVDELAKIGLRTLIITQKLVTEKEFKEWYAQYEEANTSLENREANVRKVVELLEFDMEFLGITGVEDKLQEDVNPTIESLREAGINVWMLTGDKVETAICIAISAGFKSAKQEMFVMRDITDPIEIQNQLAIFNNKLNCVLIIDGATLHCAMEYHKKYFFDVAGKAPAVVCCRCSPTQKADVTMSIKEFTGKKTCAIGDGGNDVGMIQASDVGVGIVGKEGKQAALAADFSIMKFKYVKTLMLWHGRNAYKRTAVMSQFVIHRGLIISLIQQLFSLIYYYVDMQYYNGFLMLGYATAFTSFPIFCIVKQSCLCLMVRFWIMTSRKMLL
jgi:phospholipid-translocating ATPase